MVSSRAEVRGDSTLQALSDCTGQVNYRQINFNHGVFICEITCNDKKHLSRFIIELLI